MADRGMLERSWERDVRWRANIALWLLDDLGWQHVDPRDEFYLTLPAHELAHWLRYTLQQADAMCEEQRGLLMDAETSARNHARTLSLAGRDEDAVVMVELGVENRDSARRALDEMLDLRLVATALLERLEAAR